MRTYAQYCAVAKALDVVGDRWTLLIVRELLARGRCRYTDLRDGLPGIATNLLAERLRELEGAGIVARELAPPPIATTLFLLTPRGRELEPVLQQLGRWGAALLAQRVEGDSFRGHWLAVPLQHHLKDVAPERGPVAIELRVGDEQPLTLQSAGDGSVSTSSDAPPEPDAVVEGDAPTVLALLLGKLSLAKARAAGLRFQGDRQALRRLQRG